MCVRERLAFNRNNQGHRYASQRPPGNGKIDAARIADLVPRLNGAAALFPISYTQFPSKRKKNALRTFVSASTLVPAPARAIIFHPTSHCLRGDTVHPATESPPPSPHTHTHTRVSATLASSPLERTSEILSFSTALFSLEIMCLLLRSHVARHRRGVHRDFFTTLFIPAFY